MINCLVCSLKALNKGGWAGGFDIPQAQSRCRGDVMMLRPFFPPSGQMLETLTTGRLSEAPELFFVVLKHYIMALGQGG